MPRVTDEPLIAKKLAMIETCVEDLRRLSRPDALAKDVREARFVERTLQIAIQAALDAASHIVSDERLGEPRTNRELFEILLKAGWLPESLASRLKNMIGFRNILVHGYEIVDLDVVRDILENRLGDLLDFVKAIRTRLKTS